MGLTEEVHTLTQSTEDLLLKAREWSSLSAAGCKEVVSTIKRIIKTRKAAPLCRLRALTLHHHCMLTSNVSYLNFAGKKIMSRLTILAQHRRGLTAMDRGEDIFGTISLRSEENKQASVQFLVSLLGYIRIWAGKFGRHGDGRNTIYLEAYMKLLSLGVTFPPEEAPDGLTETCRTSAELLTEVLRSPKQDTDLLLQLSSTLRSFLPRLHPTQSALIAVVNTALQQYDAWKDGQVTPRAAVPASPRLSRSSTEAVLSSQSKLNRLHSLETELADLQRQTQDFLSLFSLKKKQAEDMNLQAQAEIAALIQMQNQELETKKAKLKVTNEIGEAEKKQKDLIAELQTLELCIRDKDKALLITAKEIAAAEEENQRLRKLLAENAGNAFFPGSVVGAKYETLVEILKSDRGVLYSDLDIEVRYEVQADLSLTLYLRNNMLRPMLGLKTQVKDSDGLIVAISREEEQTPVKPGDIVRRHLSSSLRDCYDWLPHLLVTYQSSVCIECLLPLSFLRVLTPRPLPRPQEVWELLAAESESQPLLHTELWFSRFFASYRDVSLLSAAFQEEVVLVEYSSETQQLECRAKRAELRTAVLSSICLVDSR